MATRMQSAARRRAHRVHYEYCRGAAVQIQKGMRGRAGRRRYEDARNEWLGRATPGAMAIQARWRATAPARTLRAQRAAAKVIQSTYRMVRIRRLHSRLLAAAEFLKKGGVLAKYKMSPSALNSQEPKPQRLGAVLCAMLTTTDHLGPALLLVPKGEPAPAC